MTVDPRTPVIIGVAQVSHRLTADEPLADAPDAIDLMASALREASIDSAVDADRVLELVDTIAVVGGLWRYRNPAALIATELGMTQPLHGIRTTFGGNLPIQSVHTLAERIRAGETDIAVLVGGEATLTRRALAKTGEKPRRREEADEVEVEIWGPPLQMGDAVATDRGGEEPRHSYAVLDSAIRAARGETLDDARDRAARLWAGYAAVGATNPHAADRSGPTAAEIREPSERNRMVAWPYTKAMCANNNVDQAAAVVLCSTAIADDLGVPHDRRVHPTVCVNSHDTTTLLEREHLHVAPGLHAAAAALVDELGSVEAIDHIDLYSCFPSIVTLTTEALGFDPTRQLTVTGGLAFAGAPLNFAAGQGLVAMVDTLRNDPGSLGVVQGNGGHATKHSFGAYSTTPPSSPHHVVDIRPEWTAKPVAAADREGDGRLLGVTVEHRHSGPERAIAIVEFDDGTRTWGVSSDRDLMRVVTEEETVGRRVHVVDGEMSLLP